MKRVAVFFLLIAYAGCALARVGGHYIHILPALAFAITIYGLFSAKSATPVD